MNAITIMRMKHQLILQAGIPIHRLDIDREEDRHAIERIYALWCDAQPKESV